MTEALIGVALTAGLAFVVSLLVAVPLVLRALATRGEVAGPVRGCLDDDVPGCECEDCGETPAIVAGTDAQWMSELCRAQRDWERYERTGRLPW